MRIETMMLIAEVKNFKLKKSVYNELIIKCGEEIGNPDDFEQEDFMYKVYQLMLSKLNNK